MEYVIDETSPVHPYAQLAAELRKAIASGKITARVPSLTQLCEDTGLAPNTVRRAVRVLAEEGLVYTVPGRGTFVTQGRSTGG